MTQVLHIINSYKLLITWISILKWKHDNFLMLHGWGSFWDICKILNVMIQVLLHTSKEMTNYSDQYSEVKITVTH